MCVHSSACLNTSVRREVHHYSHSSGASLPSSRKQVGCRQAISKIFFEQRNISVQLTGKVKFTLEEAMKAQGGVEVQPYFFLASALDGGGWSTSRSGRFTPGKDPVPIV